MFISCATSCINEGLEKYVRFASSCSSYSICDDESTYMKNLLDIIFNEKCFVQENKLN